MTERIIPTPNPTQHGPVHLLRTPVAYPCLFVRFTGPPPNDPVNAAYEDSFRGLAWMRVFRPRTRDLRSGFDLQSWCALYPNIDDAYVDGWTFGSELHPEDTREWDGSDLGTFGTTATTERTHRLPDSLFLIVGVILFFCIGFWLPAVAQHYGWAFVK